MKKYTIIFEKAALKFLRKQDKNTQTRLLNVINKLPEGTDIKKLQGHSELYRLRVGNFRVIYTIKEELRIIDIENIDNRGDIYKNY